MLQQAQAIPPHTAFTELADSPELARIDSASARGLNCLARLCHGRELTLAGLALTVLGTGAPDARDTPHEGFRFRLGTHVGELGLSTLAQSLLLKELHPDLLPLTLRHALLADALAPLLSMLEGALAQPFSWLPPAQPGVHAEAGASMDALTGPITCFALAPTGLGRDTGCRGHLRFASGVSLEQLLSPVRGLSGPRSAALAAARFDHLRLPLIVRLGTTRLSIAEVHGIRRGDIVSIERWRSAGSAIGVDIGWAGARSSVFQSMADGARITVQTRKDDFMTSANSPDPVAAHDANPIPLDRLDAMEVTLQFQVGGLTISLGELRSVGPGYVFELPDPINRSPVRIVSNGNVLGTGYLVAVGDRLGVRVSAFAPNANE